MNENKHLYVTEPNKDIHYGFMWEKTPQMIRDEFPELEISELERELLEQLIANLWTYSPWDIDTGSYPATIEELIRRLDYSNKVSLVNDEWYISKYGEDSRGRKYPEYGFTSKMLRAKLDTIIMTLGIADRMKPFDKETELNKYSS